LQHPCLTFAASLRPRTQALVLLLLLLLLVLAGVLVQAIRPLNLHKRQLGLQARQVKHIHTLLHHYANSGFRLRGL
jgi:hypothetical protein